MMWMSPVTGLAALNNQNMKRYEGGNRDPGANRNGPPDDDGKGGDNKGGGKGKKMPTLPAFMPGQQKMLANQLNQGFGGGMGHWNDYLGQSFNRIPNPQFTPGLLGGGGGGNGGGGGLKNLLGSPLDWQVAPDGSLLPPYIPIVRK